MKAFLFSLWMINAISAFSQTKLWSVITTAQQLAQQYPDSGQLRDDVQVLANRLSCAELDTIEGAYVVLPLDTLSNIILIVIDANYPELSTVPITPDLFFSWPASWGAIPFANQIDFNCQNNRFITCIRENDLNRLDAFPIAINLLQKFAYRHYELRHSNMSFLAKQDSSWHYGFVSLGSQLELYTQKIMPILIKHQRAEGLVCREKLIEENSAWMSHAFRKFSNFKDYFDTFAVEVYGWAAVNTAAYRKSYW